MKTKEKNEASSNSGSNSAKCRQTGKDLLVQLINIDDNIRAINNQKQLLEDKRKTIVKEFHYIGDEHYKNEIENENEKVPYVFTESQFTLSVKKEIFLVEIEIENENITITKLVNIVF